MCRITYNNIIQSSHIIMKRGIIGAIIGGIAFVGLLTALLVATGIFIDRGDSNYVGPLPLVFTEERYKVGSPIFFSVRGILDAENGNLVFVTPKNEIYTTIPYDGNVKESFNQYFRIAFTKSSICSIEDIVGVWTVYFNGTHARQPVMFEIINELEVGASERYQSQC